MMAAKQRSSEAARRVLEARVRDAEVDVVDLELAAWVIGRSGEGPPSLPDATEDLHVRQAAAFGAGEPDEAFELLDANVETDHGDHLLLHACHLVGDRYADRLVELAERHPDVMFNGAMLARTAMPDRLLALFEPNSRSGHLIATVGELVIRGRDDGSPHADAEARWRELDHDGAAGAYEQFRNGSIRIAARESLETAIALLEQYDAGWDYTEQTDGAIAVLARLVRQNARRASQLVATRKDASQRIAWLEGLVWWRALPQEAEPIVDELLARPKLDEPRVLAQLLALARTPERLERAIPKLAGEDPSVVARGMAASVARLRDAGLTDDAEAARERIVRWLGDRRETGGLALRDRFDAFATAGLPPLEPWEPEPGVP